MHEKAQLIPLVGDAFAHSIGGPPPPGFGAGPVPEEDMMPVQKIYINFVRVVLYPFIMGFRLMVLQLLVAWEKLEADFVDPILPSDEAHRGAEELARTSFVAATKYEALLDDFSIEFTRLLEAMKHRMGQELLVVWSNVVEFFASASWQANVPGFNVSVIYPYEQSFDDTSLWVPDAGIHFCGSESHILRREIYEVGRVIFLATSMEKSLRDEVGPAGQRSRLRLNSGFWTRAGGTPFEHIRLGQESSGPRRARPIRVFPVGTGHDIIVTQHQLLYKIGKMERHYLQSPMITKQAPAWDMTNSLVPFHCDHDRPISDFDSANSYVAIQYREWNEYACSIQSASADLSILLKLCLQALPLLNGGWFYYLRLRLYLLTERDYVMEDGNLPIAKDSLIGLLDEFKGAIEGFIGATKHRFLAMLVSMRAAGGRPLVTGNVDPSSVVFPHETGINSQQSGLMTRWLDLPVVFNAFCLVGSVFYRYTVVIDEMVDSIARMRGLQVGLVRRSNPSAMQVLHRNQLSSQTVLAALAGLNVSDKLRQRTRDSFMKKSAGLH